MALFCLALLGCSRAVKDHRVKTAKDIDTLRNAYAAFNRGDMDNAVSALDADVDWTEPAEFPGGGTYRGRDAVKAYLTRSRAGWAEGASEPEQLIPAGDKIVVFVRARFRLKNSPEWHEVKLADVYTLRDHTIVQMRAFADRQEALRWAGVPVTNTQK
jgi:ketosteroid isomerase-like protein